MKKSNIFFVFLGIIIVYVLKQYYKILQTRRSIAPVRNLDQLRQCIKHDKASQNDSKINEKCKNDV